MNNPAGQGQDRRCIGCVAILAMLAILVSASTAFGFEGQRKGFALGFGLGVGWAQDISDNVSVATDLKIGYAISDQVVLYYAGRQIWIDAKQEGEDPWPFISWFVNPSLGVSYYLTAKAPAVFLSGGIGAALMDNMGTEPGLAPYLGVGYEFARHWSVVFEFTQTWINNDTIWDARLYVSGMAY